MKPIIVSSFLMATLLGSGCAFGAGRADFDDRLNSIVSPYRFSIAGWEWKTAVRQAEQWLSPEKKEAVKTDDEIGVVTEYFQVARRMKALQVEIEAAKSGTGGGTTVQLEVVDFGEDPFSFV